MRWRYAAARRTGSSHERSGLPCQDAFHCQLWSNAETSAFVAVVSDGAGSATRGGVGAEFVCENLAAQVVLQFPQRGLPRPG